MGESFLLEDVKTKKYLSYVPHRNSISNVEAPGNVRQIVHTKRQNGKTIISIHDDHSKRREKERRQCNNVWGAKKVFFSLQERIWMGILRLRNKRDMLSEVFSLLTNLVFNESRN